MDGTNKDKRLTAIANIRAALLNLGFPVEEESMADTPRRVVDSWLEMTRGQHEDPADHLAVTFSAEEYDQAVALAGIPFVSVCEHHMLPFIGTASVAYLPDKQVVGLSKLARTVDIYARRPQLQERLTKQIADAISTNLEPRGVAVVVEAAHSCMTSRGALKPGALMRTSALRGVFRTSPEARVEAMKLLNGG